MSSPFIVKVPDGATEIDLGPILRPLVWALKGHLSVSDGRPHTWGSNKEIEKCSLDELDDIMGWATNALRYQEQLRKVTRPTLLAFLGDKGWVDEDGRGYVYIQDYEMKKLAWDRHGDKIHLRGHEAKLNLSNVDAIVSKLAYADRKTKLEKVDEILSYESILDRIARETT